MAIVKIVKNTYPNANIYNKDTVCIWIKDSLGWLYLYPTDDSKKHADYSKEPIMCFGKIYSQKGYLLSNKKEPIKVGLVAKFKKAGWYLEVENIVLANER